MSIRNMSVVAAVAALSLSPVASAAVLFTDPGESLTNFTVVKDSFSNDSTAAANVDYGALGIPEAPNTVAGSAPTRGIQLTANKGDATAQTTGINLILGAVPQTFTGTHTLQFDVWANAPAGATSSTEGILAGVVRATSNDALVRNFRTSRGSGGWAYLAADNGNASDDFRLLNNGTSAVVFGDHEVDHNGKFNSAFQGTLQPAPVADDADNEWVRVSVVEETDGVTGTVSVYYNGVLFGSTTTTNTSGFAWFGYDDFFNSIGSNTLYGIFDNITVVEGNAVPEPSVGLAVLGLAGVMLRRHRRV